MIRLTLLLLLATFSALAADDPLEAEQAYRLEARALDPNTIEVRWRIADGYYMYRDKIRFMTEPASVKLGEPKLPPGKIKDDEFFGKVETYRGELAIAIPVLDAGGATTFTLKAASQGCWDGGVCYPPMTQQAKISLAGAPASGAPAAVRPGGDSESGAIAGLLKNGGFWIVLASFFGFGLLLTFTPCVFPMIPILSGIIVHHGHALTHARAFFLSAAYVLGMAATYAAVGVAAGFSGTLLSAALQNAWVLGGFALVFVVLSLSMFGFYELQLPAALQGRLSEKANRQGGSFGAIAVMGALSALIVGPCVAAPLAGALLYIAQTKDAALGGAALFAMGLGMGAPLLAVGVFSRSLLPKAGPWMDAVKKFFGVVMLATALWMVSPVIPAWAQMLGWALLLIVPAIHMHAIDLLPAHASGWQRLWKGIGLVMLLAGTAMLAGILGGSRDPLQPLGFLRSAAGTAAAPEAHAVKFERILDAAELDERLRQAAAAGKPVMLDFYADWCVTCKELEKFTFADPKVAARLKDFVLLQADVTANSDEDKALLKRFDLFGPPGILFFDRSGKELAYLTVIGYLPPEKFLPIVERALR
ncbi:MAG: protein-disulfide reductase DsbD [Candidatus Nitricoxidivorans perseverans]|uniref:Thiol:disulfide interchange protein DsbD n=1 Tax=Candidatus Nitricoxidivorans perseverans TaxID=2975601 RepID=A0AA49IXT3_9PROT|nr:MAG: protein-disulfide reductase DsbD [Candidatus Nitricoxidivorans perseverans]